MTRNLRIETTLPYSLTQLAEMHNETFEGYFFPMSMTAEQRADFWRIHHLDARYGVVLRASDGALVGHTVIGLRGHRAWCGGFGIVPAFRGQGMARILADAMVTSAREAGAKTLQLEVLTQNELARKVYERAGFVTQRRVAIFQMPVALLSQRSGQTRGVAEAIEPGRALSVPPANKYPVWQREPATILGGESYASQFTGPDGAVSRVVYQLLGTRLSIVAADLSTSHSPEDFAGWWAHLAEGIETVRVLNEPIGTRLHSVGLALGAEVTGEQFDMRLEL